MSIANRGSVLDHLLAATDVLTDMHEAFLAGNVPYEAFLEAMQQHDDVLAEIARRQRLHYDRNAVE